MKQNITHKICDICFHSTLQGYYASEDMQKTGKHFVQHQSTVY